VSIPTITSVSPARGHTGGLGLVEVLGTGFKTWAIPAPTGAPSGPVWPTVEVLFGGRRGSNVAVVSSTRLFVRAPPSPLAVTGPRYGEGPVDVTVRNINEDGSVVTAETATLADAYTYERPQLGHMSDLGRLVRELIRALRSQTLANVSISTHTDWDGDVSDLENIVEVAALPAVVLFGPRLIENKFFTQHGTLTAAAPGGGYAERPAPQTDDLVFMLVGVSNQKLEAFALQSAVRQFFKKNPWLYLERDPEQPDLGFVKYDMVLDPAGIGFDPASDQKSNLRSFSGSFVVRGFDHEDLAGFPGDDVIARGAIVTESPEITTVKKG